MTSFGPLRSAAARRPRSAGRLNLEQLEERNLLSAPAAEPDDAVTYESTSVAIFVLANDSDPDGDPIAITAVFGTDNGAVEFIDPDTPDDPSDDFLIYIPNPGFVGTDQLSYEISDPDGNTATASVFVVVDPVAPEVLVGGGATLNEGDTFGRANLLFLDPGQGPWTAAVHFGDGGAGPFTPVAIKPGNFFDLQHLYPDSGSYTVAVRVTDEFGLTGEGTFAVTVRNVAPTATFGSDELVVQFSNQADVSPADVAAGFTYSYDFNHDGVFEVIDSPSASVEVPAAFLPAPGDYVIGGRIKDKDGGYSDYTTIVTAPELNSPPAAAVAGPGDGVRGQQRLFTVSATDPDAADAAAGFRYQIDWGDGSPAQVVEPSPGNGAGVALVHTFTAAGSFTVRVTATDAHGAVSAEVTQAVAVTAAAVQADPLAPGQTMLVVGGTTGDDRIRLDRTWTGAVKVTVNGAAAGTFTPTGRLVVYAQDGNDDVGISLLLRSPAWLFGGGGNDLLVGGSGTNVLVGGDGDDALFGGFGRDVLIGGAGQDVLSGVYGGDLMVAGATAFDANEVALAAIVAEWTSARDLATRTANLQGTGSGPRANGDVFLVAGGGNATVFDDGAVDVLLGWGRTDLVFATTTGEKKDVVVLL